MSDHRRIHNLSLPAALGCCLFFNAAIGLSDERIDRAEAEAFFEGEIRPVLIEHCISCHGPTKQEGGLRLDSAAALESGGDSGPALMPGKPSESLMVDALKYESLEMPPAAPLEESVIERIELWIAQGAHWPEQSTLLRPATDRISAEDRQWWAFQPLARREPPPVVNAAWPSNAIDHFVLARMEAAELTPAPVADDHVLVRRLYLDLIGLPPTVEELSEACGELRAAASDGTAKASAWKSLVDRLLDDPRYGEHWARHWLDLVRYSESDGWNLDAYRPDIWRYRDYVVRSFNSDKPYPEFVRQQLAGDEIDPDDPDNLIAAGYLRLGIYEYNQRDARGHWNDIINEITDVTGDVFMGMSFSCARCHDHKFDPLPQRDYFQLRAFFEPLIWRDDLVAATPDQRRRYEQQLAKWKQATAELQMQIDALIKPYHDRKWHSTVDKFPLDIQACYFKPPEQRSSWDEQMNYLIGRQFWEEGGGPLRKLAAEDKKQLEALETEMAAWDELKPAPLPKVMTVSNHDGQFTATTIPADPEQQAISPGFPTVMSQLTLPRFTATQFGSPHADALQLTDRPSPQLGSVQLVSRQSELVAAGPLRLQLADWIGDPHNPLTSRVIVNRIWQRHFGCGIVATPSDFGRAGAEPSHPLLLDWLADEFIQQGWSFKKLHQQILCSSTWRQSAQHPQAQDYESLDPDDQLLWRAPIRRLQAEQIRDAMLVASGELVGQIGGPAVDEEAPRRALYVKNIRNNLENFLSSFDRAGGLSSVAVRDSTTTPTQALLLINGGYTMARAEKMAKHLLGQGDPTIHELLERAALSTWGRSLQPEETVRCLEFLCGSNQAPDDLPQRAANTIDARRWNELCQVLLNSNEFLYVE